MSAHIDELVSRMRLEEKVSLLAGADFWHTVPVERLGIPVMKVTDGPVGARGAGSLDGPTSACFPAGVALAATWNPALVERVGEALGEETKAKGAHILLAPTVNIHRSPLAGRNFECYSEDPYLTGQMAVSYITGLQRQGVGACIKHFVCNDSEFERHSMSSEVAERPLREIYMRPFQIGDRVRIADTLGDVVERGLLVTRLRTPKNVEVTIPNSMVLGNYIVNYSSTVGEGGVILHTTVTLGYDLDWREVHEAMKEAARRTEGVLEDPAPFVLQTALGDYAVSYELNAYTDQPQSMAQIYSGLHQNLQDALAEAGIEILSPVYHALRDGNLSTIPAPHTPSDAEAPAFRIRKPDA